MHTFDHHPNPRRIRAAGVLYTPDTGNREILGDFAAAIKKRGFRIGGVVQEVLTNDDGSKGGVDVIDVATGERTAISRPTKHELEAGACTLDKGALADSTAPLRAAIKAGAELMVVEKFGEREQYGEGLSDEILNSIAEGIPTLVAVPANALEAWNRFSGGLADLLPSTPQALWRWWGTEHLYRDLIRGVPEVEVKRLVLGLNWTLVEGPYGCGLAQSPSKATNGCRAVPGAGAHAGKNLRQLAELAESWNPFEAAIGIAAMNAHYNRYDLEGSEENGLDTVASVDGLISVVGRFPGMAKRLPNVAVAELTPEDDEYPATAAPWLLRGSEGAVITASTLVNHSLPGLLDKAAHCKTVLVGPGTPLTDRLFSYGVDVLSGLVVTDPEGAARATAEGGSAGTLKKFARFVTLKSGG